MDVHLGERVKNVRCTKDSLRVDLIQRIAEGLIAVSLGPPSLTAHAAKK